MCKIGNSATSCSQLHTDLVLSDEKRHLPFSLKTTSFFFEVLY